jgi:uncharacterized peroxidase-related enzyme
MSAPAPRVTVEAEPFFPYVEEKDYPEDLKPVLRPYQERMGFIPNALKVYMHRPEIAKTLWQLNGKVMRDPSSVLDAGLKRKIGTVCSAVNGCTYCTSHHCSILKKPASTAAEGWDLSDEQVQDLITGKYQPADEFERVCFDFARAASADPSNVPSEIHDRRAEHLSPPQIMELAAVVGFWKMYNTIHDSLNIPIEAHVLPETGYVGLADVDLWVTRNI